MTQPVEILYAIPVGAVIAWYPLAGAVTPPGFAFCDGQVIVDADSPYDGMMTPNLTNRFILGDIPGSTLNQVGGSVEFNLNGWASGSLSTSPTQVAPQDNVPPDIIRRNQDDTGGDRYSLSSNSDGWNDGNHHHTIGISVPGPAWLNLVYIMRIK